MKQLNKTLKVETIGQGFYEISKKLITLEQLKLFEYDNLPSNKTGTFASVCILFINAMELLASPYHRCIVPIPSDAIREFISFHFSKDISFNRMFIR